MEVPAHLCLCTGGTVWCVYVRVFSRLVLSNFFDPTDCTLPSFSVHGILQASIQEWVAISYSGGSSWPSDQSHFFRVFCIACRFVATEPPGTWGFHSHQSDADLPWVSLSFHFSSYHCLYICTYICTYMMVLSPPLDYVMRAAWFHFCFSLNP